MENFMSFEYFMKPNILAAAVITICAYFNYKHAVMLQDKAFDMPEDSDTDRICRQIKLLETRLYAQSNWVIFALAVIIFFL